MNARHRVRNLARRICAAALLCAAASVSAQTVFKLVDATGTITFTDRPETTPLPQTATAPALEEARAPAGIHAVSPRHAAIIDANEAARRLRQAQLKREQGMEPLPGEQARGSGAGVVNHRYWRRQEKLRRVVEQAQRRSSETRGPQLAAR